MKQVPSAFKAFHIFLAAFAAVAIQGCASGPPAPETDEKSLIIMSITMKIAGDTASIHFQKEDVTLERIDEKGQSLGKLNQSFTKGGYFYFVNVPPGKYRIYGLKITTVTKERGGFFPPKRRFSLASQAPVTRVADFRVSKEAASSTVVVVGAGKVTFLGDFIAQASAPYFPRASLNIHKMTGERTVEGETEAYMFFRAAFPDSPWLAALPAPR